MKIDAPIASSANRGAPLLTSEGRLAGLILSDSTNSTNAHAVSAAVIREVLTRGELLAQDVEAVVEGESSSLGQAVQPLLGRLARWLAEDSLDSIVEVKTRGSFGTGFVVDHEGRSVLVTAHHVVEDSPQFSIVTRDGEEQLMETEFSDPARDLAQAELPPGLSLPTLELDSGDADKTPLTPFIAAGNGNAQGIAVHLGAVSGYGTPENLTRRMLVSGDFNPGDSGGPTLNLVGRVTEVAVAKMLSPDEGFGLVTPVGQLRRFLEEVYPAPRAPVRESARAR